MYNTLKGASANLLTAQTFWQRKPSDSANLLTAQTFWQRKPSDSANLLAAQIRQRKLFVAGSWSADAWGGSWFPSVHLSLKLRLESFQFNIFSLYIKLCDNQGEIYKIISYSALHPVYVANFGSCTRNLKVISYVKKSFVVLLCLFSYCVDILYI
jgi:hypothetical protein